MLRLLRLLEAAGGRHHGVSLPEHGPELTLTELIALLLLETTGGHHSEGTRSLESTTEGTTELTLTDIVGGLGNISGLLGRSEVGSVDIGVGELCDNEGTM